MASMRKYPWDRRPFIARALSANSSPTADIYFAWSFADRLESGEILRLSPTVFLVGRTLIVMRHDAGLKQVPDFDKLIFFCDDDWREGVRDPLVPRDYRAKLRLVEAEAAKRLEKSADIIVVPSQVLAIKYKLIYPSIPVKIVTPVWRPIAKSDSIIQDKNVEIAYLGTRSHRADFEFLVPILSRLLDAIGNIRFTFSGEHTPPRAWLEEPRIRIVQAMSWHDYQNWMEGKSFDIGLYPLVSGSFARARSANKFLEYEQSGAAVVASSRWRSALPVEVDKECIFLNDDQDNWFETILELVQSPETRNSMVSASRAIIARHYSIHKQRERWEQILDALHH